MLLSYREVIDKGPHNLKLVESFSRKRKAEEILNVGVREQLADSDGFIFSKGVELRVFQLQWSLVPFINLEETTLAILNVNNRENFEGLQQFKHIPPPEGTLFNMAPFSLHICQITKLGKFPLLFACHTVNVCMPLAVQSKRR